MHPQDKAAHEALGAIRAITRFKHRSPAERLAMIQQELEQYAQLLDTTIVKTGGGQ